MNVVEWLQIEASQVREQAAARLQGWIPEADADGGVQAMECFPLFTLHAEALHTLSEDAFVDALSFLDRWHVQVAMQGNPLGYARGVETAGGFAIESWTRDSLCGKIDAAISTADAALPGDTHLAVLLEVMPFDLSALVFVPRVAGRIFVVVLHIAGADPATIVGRLMPAAELLDRAKKFPLVRGLLQT